MSPDEPNQPGSAEESDEARDLFARVAQSLRDFRRAENCPEARSALLHDREDLSHFQGQFPNSVPALRLLAECAQRLGKMAEARDYISRAELLDPWDLEILIIAESLYESDDGQRKRKAHEPVRPPSALDEGVVNSEKLIEKAMGSFRLGDLERAYTLAKLAYRVSPENQHHLMDVLSAGSAYDPERTHRELSHLFLEGDPPAYLYLALGSICNVRGLYQDATVWLSRGIDEEPKDPFVLAMLLNELAYVMAKQSVRLDQCVALARAALELFPDKQANGFIRDTLGVTYLKIGDYDKAVRNLREAASKDRTVIPCFHLALALLHKQDAGGALTELKQVATARPSLESPHVEELAILDRVQSYIGRLEDLLHLGSADDIKDALTILDGLI